MAEKEKFSFGEGATETVKHLLRATVHGFVEEANRPDECEVVKEIEAFIGELPSIYRMGMVWLLRALEIAPLIMGYGRQFGNLELADQVKVLEDFEASAGFAQRAMALSLKNLVIICYFDRAEIHRALGYDHSCLVQAGR